MFDTIIKSRKVITGGQVKEAFVAISGGIIAEVWETLPDGIQQEITDVDDLVLMAGVVDPHVHINEPGRTDWEGFNTATLAALVGGVTTLVEMPLNASPVTTTVQAFEQKLSRARNGLHVHCGFWGGVVPGNENELEGLISQGVQGFKAFLTHSGIDEFPNVTEADLRKVMPLIAKHDLPLLVHCELTDDDTTSNTSSSSYYNYLLSRPKQWEDKAIALMLHLCEEYHCRVHIVHLSSADSIDQIRAAKVKGLPVTVETAQHYLYFNAEDIADGQTQFKCAPPIRERENNGRLWDALKEGIIDFVATDHSPAPPGMKETETGSFMKVWGGIASLQFALSALWTAGKSRSVSLPSIASWLCEKPGNLIAKSHKKGRIEQGYDADLIAWNPDASIIVTPDIIRHKHKMTPYLYEQLYGVVEQTWLKGVKAYDRLEDFIELKKGEELV